LSYPSLLILGLAVVILGGLECERTEQYSANAYSPSAGEVVA
jgi:hypothetical protein